jgi:hypothetical protein
VAPDKKLPVLYLVDSIVKNIGGPYQQLFQRNIVTSFRHVYESVDEGTRVAMRRLLSTWHNIWPQKAKLMQDYISRMTSRPGIHVNPFHPLFQQVGTDFLELSGNALTSHVGTTI